MYHGGYPGGPVRKRGYSPPGAEPAGELYVRRADVDRVDGSRSSPRGADGVGAPRGRLAAVERATGLLVRSLDIIGISARYSPYRVPPDRHDRVKTLISPDAIPVQGWEDTLISALAALP